MTLEKACKTMLIKYPFYGLFLLQMDKAFDASIPTACVRRNGLNLSLLVNEDYWNESDDTKQLCLLVHEMLHVAYQHFFFYDLFPKKELLNLAADFEVNSWIDAISPDWHWLLPTEYGFLSCLGFKAYYKLLDRVDEDKTGSEEGLQPQGSSAEDDNIRRIERGLAPSEIKKIKDLIERAKEFDHGWKDFGGGMSDAEKQLLKDAIDGNLKRAAEGSTDRGYMPANLRDYIDKLLLKRAAVFNWKAYFRRMLGFIYDVNVKKTKKKESKRFVGASGLKHKKKSSIFVVVDTSGSIGTKDLKEFFTEINYVYKAGTKVTICECDMVINRIIEYKGKYDGNVQGGGGTSMTPAIRYFNQHRNDYQTIILFTDGYVESNPEKILGNAIWVITANGNKNRQYQGKTIFIPSNNE